MAATIETLHPPAGEESPSESYGRFSTGILPSHVLTRLLDQGRELTASEPFAPGQIQPASIDLRLGPVAYRVRASFLAGPAATVDEKLRTVFMHEVDLRDGAVLEAGCVYIVPLLERAEFSARIFRWRQSQKLHRPHRRLYPADHRLCAVLRPDRAGLSRPALW